MYKNNQNISHQVKVKREPTLIEVMIILLGFFVISIVVQPSHYAFANEFIKMPIRVHTSPTICAIEPQADTNFPKIGSQLLDKTEYAVLDWKTKLNAALGRHPLWNINLIKVPLVQQSGYDYSKCDITIHYLPKPQTNDEFSALGITIPNFETGKTNIEIYYMDVQINSRMVTWYEGKQEYYNYVYDPYYTGRVATDTQLSGTITHEIGHSLGLGHYVILDEERKKIISGMEDMPSIMVDTATVLGVTHYDITPLDVNQIKSIYGDGGFDKQITPQGDYQRIHILRTDKQAYSNDDYIIKIFIDTSKIKDGNYGAILITDSNSKLDDHFGISQLNSTIYHKNQQNTEKGKYWIEFINPYTGDYDYTSFTTGPVEIAKTDLVQKAEQIKQAEPVKEIEPVPPTESTQIPTWIKNNAKYWSESQLDDSEFIKGIQYLIDKGIMIVPKVKSGDSSSDQIPKWIKTNAGWWAQGQLSDTEFVKGIQYLVNNGAIKLS